MKKTIVALVSLGMFSAIAHADYSQTVARQQYCRSMGNIAALAYRDRVKGTPKEVVLSKVAAQLDEDAKQAEFLHFGIDYAYGQATDQADAHMKAWSHCMDNTY
jgi:hypothetical protein